MQLQPKLQRIFKLLQEAKAEGVLEIDILDNFESKGYAKVIKHRLNKSLGRGMVYSKEGRWYLDKSYWEILPADFKDIMYINEISKMRTIIFISVLTNIVMFASLVTFLLLVIQFN